MHRRAYDTFNQGKPIYCPTCGESRPEMINCRHGGDLQCAACKATHLWEDWLRQNPLKDLKVN